MFESLYSVISRLLFPPKCIICNEFLNIDENIPFCKNCLRKISPAGLRLQSGCEYDSIVSAVYYKPPVSNMLIELKINENAYKIKHLSMLAADAAKKEYSGIRFDFLTVVPSSKQSIHDAGFDRMDIFGKKLSQIMKIKYNPHAVKKIRKSKKQHTLSQKERLTAQKGVFYADPKIVSGKDILLFDDIVTTGSTLNECAFELKRAGAKHVYCVTVAATKLDQNKNLFKCPL